MFAYAAAPENTVKGVIGGIPLSETPEMIRAKIVNIYNGTALETHRIGNSHAVIVLFKGDKVPSHVKYCGALIKCRLYRQHKEVCKTCGQVGHRKDVCPRPNAVVCFACGKTNPGENHEQECKPRCKLCGGSHPTGTGNCANKFKTPFVLRKREHERKMAATAKRATEEKPGNKVRFSRKDEFPELTSPTNQRGRSKSRSASRSGLSRSRGGSRSHSRNRRRSLSRDGHKLWADVAKGATKSAAKGTAKGADKGSAAKEHQRSSTPAGKKMPAGDPLASKMAQLENTIKLLQETVKQQQKTMLQQTELIAKLTSQQHGSQQQAQPWSLGTAQQPASLTPRETPVLPLPTPSPAAAESSKAPRSKKARRSSAIEPSDDDEDNNSSTSMNTGDDETEVTAQSTLTFSPKSTDALSSNGINYGTRIKHLTERLNKQEKRINEVSQKVDNVAAAMKNLKTDLKNDIEARINSGFEEMKRFMAQLLKDELGKLLKEELGKLGHGNHVLPGTQPNHG